jgi:hypothetical protein
MENTAPTGYLLDPAAYAVTIGAGSASIILNVTDAPAGGGGAAAAITVAGLTEGGGIQVLAFTGITPIIPVSGGAAIIAGLAMLVATLLRRNSRKLSLAKKED